MFSITFTGIDPTIFNFVSDLFSVVGRLGLGLALSYIYGIIMSWQVTTGKAIHVGSVGKKPEHFLDAAMLVRDLHWSLPALVFAALFLAADFSQSIADLGLSFVTIQLEGPSDIVLDLTKRNPFRLIQVNQLIFCHSIVLKYLTQLIRSSFSFCKDRW